MAKTTAKNLCVMGQEIRLKTMHFQNCNCIFRCIEFFCYFRFLTPKCMNKFELTSNIVACYRNLWILRLSHRQPYYTCCPPYIRLFVMNFAESNFLKSECIFQIRYYCLSDNFGFVYNLSKSDRSVKTLSQNIMKQYTSFVWQCNIPQPLPQFWGNSQNRTFALF